MKKNYFLILLVTKIQLNFPVGHRQYWLTTQNWKKKKHCLYYITNLEKKGKTLNLLNPSQMAKLSKWPPTRTSKIVPYPKVSFAINNPQYSENKFLWKYEVDMLKIITIMIGCYTLNNFIIHHSRSWKNYN